MPGTINVVNIALMVVAALPAFLWPFESFIFAYAFVGPLHYLTEISWLHDRRWFATGRADPWLLAAATGLITLWLFRPVQSPVDWTAALVLVAFAAAAGMAFLASARGKLLVAAIALAVAVPLCLDRVGANLVVRLLPTIVHVFVFTGAFILFGALKQRSRSGFLSFAIFVATAALLLAWRPSAAGYELSPATFERAQGVRPTHAILTRLFGIDRQWDGAVALMRFLAWAYVYHYLNWFSKTKVIGWHEISKARAAAILALYAAAIATYLHDWRLGLDVLFFLSLLHVLLEFPLNHQSFVGIWRELRRPAAARPPAPSVPPAR